MQYILTPKMMHFLKSLNGGTGNFLYCIVWYGIVLLQFNYWGKLFTKIYDFKLSYVVM